MRRQDLVFRRLKVAGPAHDCFRAVIRSPSPIPVTAAGVDWESEGLLGPSSTWTYLVNDNVFTSNAFHTLSVRASFGLWAVLICWPLLLAWGAAKHWRRWREAAGGGSQSESKVSQQ